MLKVTRQNLPQIFRHIPIFLFFFLNDPAPTEIYTLSLHDALPILRGIVEVLKRKFPGIREPAKDDICYATQNRQNAVKELGRRCRVVLVVGAPTSSNANRLVEVAENGDTRAYLIESAADIRPEWIKGDVGITAGASTPENIVQACVERVRSLGNYRLAGVRLGEERGG